MAASPLIFLKISTLSSYFFSILYTHFRGTVKLSPLKQLTDHSSLMAPVNAVMYLFSAVPKTPFLPLSSFPELDILKQNWEVIKTEAEKLYTEGYISSSEKYDDIGFNSFFRRGWKRFYLKWYDQKPFASAEHLCPKTLSLLKNIPGINAAMFALLPKKSFLFKHRDPYAGSLRYHLGLITPNSDDCSITVDGQNYSWRDGEAVLFDETYIHEAKNDTEVDRIILFCDVQRPLRNRLANAFNRFFSRTVMRAASSSNVPEEQLGLINRLFKYFYQVRLVGKKLKSYNKGCYYLVKYILFAALLILFFL